MLARRGKFRQTEQTSGDDPGGEFPILGLFVREDEPVLEGDADEIGQVADFELLH